MNVLLAALARRPDARAVLAQTVAAVERSGLRHAELWSYAIDTIPGRALRPVRYGSSGDVQLWNLTEIAVQFLLAQTPPRGH